MSFLFEEPMLLSITGRDYIVANGMPNSVNNVPQWLYDNKGTFLRLIEQATVSGSNAICIPDNTYSSIEEATEMDKKLIGIARRKMQESTAKRCFVGGTLNLYAENSNVLSILQNFDIIYDKCLKRARELKEAGADFMLVMRQKSLLHMRACVLAAKTAKLPIIVFINVQEDGTTLNNTSLCSAIITLQAMGATAIGIEGRLSIQSMQNILSKVYLNTLIPLLIRPTNLYLTANNFTGFRKEISDVVDLGVHGFRAPFSMYREYCSILNMVLRRCRVRKFKSKGENVFACATERETFFIQEDMNITEPINCGYGLYEDLKEAERQNKNIIAVNLESVYNVKVLIENAHMIKNPICLVANDVSILELALKNFQGRLMIDTRTLIPLPVVNKVADKYGAILY